jgi:hypothetical protein
VRAGKTDEPGTLKCLTEGCGFTRDETQEEFAPTPRKLEPTGTRTGGDDANSNRDRRWPGRQ